MTLHKVYVFIPQLESKMATWFIQVQMDLLRSLLFALLESSHLKIRYHH